MTCEAVQKSDCMVCNACGLKWDVNDPSAPQCKKLMPSYIVIVDPRKSVSSLARKMAGTEDYTVIAVFTSKDMANKVANLLNNK